MQILLTATTLAVILVLLVPQTSRYPTQEETKEASMKYSICVECDIVDELRLINEKLERMAPQPETRSPTVGPLQEKAET